MSFFYFKLHKGDADYTSLMCEKILHQIVFAFFYRAHPLVAACADPGHFGNPWFKLIKMEPEIFFFSYSSLLKCEFLD